MADVIRIERDGVDRLDDLRPVFLALHDHHRTVSAVRLTEPDDRAWAERRATYRGHLDRGRAVLHVAVRDDTVVGYAFTIVHDGSDDTFPLGDRYAELYTLAVLPDARGRGIGTALLDAVDDVLRAEGIGSLTVAVMAGNEAAVRLYRRRGLVPGELVLYRLG